MYEKLLITKINLKVTELCVYIFLSDIVYRGIVVKELFSETEAIFEEFLQYGWLFAAGVYLVYVIY